MKTYRKIILLFSLLIVVCLIWYFFFKTSDYVIQFKEKTSPGTLYSSAEEWSFLNGKKGDFKYIYTAKEPFDYLHQDLIINDLKLVVNWDFISLNDSITQVTIGFSEKKNKVLNRITAPFFKT
jgi:hypothetical protein